MTSSPLPSVYFSNGISKLLAATARASSEAGAATAAGAAAVGAAAGLVRTGPARAEPAKANTDPTSDRRPSQTELIDMGDLIRAIARRKKVGPKVIVRHSRP